jgi:hypothetical protein
MSKEDRIHGLVDGVEPLPANGYLIERLSSEIPITARTRTLAHKGSLMESSQDCALPRLNWNDTETRSAG